MNRRSSTLVGVILILVGVLALGATLVVPMLGLSAWRWGTWRFWPLIVVSVGLLCLLPPILERGRRALGGLFIPALPILTTGGILLFASVFNAWGAWEWLWPLEVLALAAGFLLAASYARVTWLLIPAIIIGANGLAFQFSVLTGLWEAWAVLWTIEPLSVGLACLVVSARKQMAGLFVAGLILCGLAGMGLIGMAAIFPRWWLINLAGPGVLVLVGLSLLVWGVLSRPPASNPLGGEATEAPAEGV
jgi:hypothetical protein